MNHIFMNPGSNARSYLWHHLPWSQSLKGVNQWNVGSSVMINNWERNISAGLPEGHCCLQQLTGQSTSRWWPLSPWWPLSLLWSLRISGPHRSSCLITTITDTPSQDTGLLLMNLSYGSLHTHPEQLTTAVHRAIFIMNIICQHLSSGHIPVACKASGATGAVLISCDFRDSLEDLLDVDLLYPKSLYLQGKHP